MRTLKPSLNRPVAIPNNYGIHLGVKRAYMFQFSSETGKFENQKCYI